MSLTTCSYLILLGKGRDKHSTQHADVTGDGMSTGDSAQEAETATHDNDQNSTHNALQRRKPNSVRIRTMKKTSVIHANVTFTHYTEQPTTSVTDTVSCGGNQSLQECHDNCMKTQACTKLYKLPFAPLVRPSIVHTVLPPVPLRSELDNIL